jgi:hypothetical protein
VVNFMVRPLYLREEDFRYPLDMRLDGSCRHSGCCEEKKKKILNQDGNRTLIPLQLNMKPNQDLDWLIPDLKFYIYMYKNYLSSCGPFCNAVSISDITSSSGN